MKYDDLKSYMHRYRMGRMSRKEMECAIHLWQRGHNQTDYLILKQNNFKWVKRRANV